MIRYRATELLVSGKGRVLYADTIRVLNDATSMMGGLWRIERQYKDYAGTWRRDQGRMPVWEVGLDYDARVAWGLA